MTELTYPMAAQPPRVAAARAALATVLAHGRALPIPLRLATASAFTELEARAELPYPPAEPYQLSAPLTADAAAGLLTAARDAITAEIGDADPRSAVGLAFAARELTDALHPTPRQ